MSVFFILMLRFSFFLKLDNVGIKVEMLFKVIWDGKVWKEKWMLLVKWLSVFKLLYFIWIVFIFILVFGIFIVKFFIFMFLLLVMIFRFNFCSLKFDCLFIFRCLMVVLIELFWSVLSEMLVMILCSLICCGLNFLGVFFFDNML